MIKVSFIRHWMGEWYGGVPAWLPQNAQTEPVAITSEILTRLVAEYDVAFMHINKGAELVLWIDVQGGKFRQR